MTHELIVYDETGKVIAQRFGDLAHLKSIKKVWLKTAWKGERIVISERGIR